MNSIKTKSYSNLQKSVLILYRDMIKFAKTKDNKDDIISFIRNDFNKNINNISWKDFDKIEYLVNKGRSQYLVYNKANVRRIRLV